MSGLAGEVRPPVATTAEAPLRTLNVCGETSSEETHTHTHGAFELIYLILLIWIHQPNKYCTENRTLIYQMTSAHCAPHTWLVAVTAVNLENFVPRLLSGIISRRWATSLTVGWCLKRYVKMTPSCPSLRRRSSGKWKKLIDVHVEEEGWGTVGGGRGSVLGLKEHEKKVTQEVDAELESGAVLRLGEHHCSDVGLEEEKRPHSLRRSVM